jgi:hypothetical protein
MCNERPFPKNITGLLSFNETTITRKIYFDIADIFAFLLSDEGKVTNFSATRSSAAFQ